MQPSRNRHARKDDSRRALLSERRSPRRLRWAVSLAALAALVTGAGSAQAATGGAAMAHGGTASAGQDLVFSPFRSAGASWYGPGLYGNRTACGQTLRPNTLGVAHRSLPCGTAVKFVYQGRALITQVIDRGPYLKGRAWDLTAAASEALEFEGAGMVHYAIAVSYARPGAKG
jgi:rare lipoprotein A (peptidoglycan hydrolase)